MNSQHFIEAVKHYVRDAAVEDTITKLRSPPGRRVSPEEQARSDWYCSLSATEAGHVNSVIAAAVHEGLFGLLAAIDGARAIDDGRGKFELFYVANQRVLLNEPRAIGLHDLLNASTATAEKNQRPIPAAALRDQDAIEMLRVWIAENGLHCSLKVGMYRETTNVPEEKAWGVILADVARHVAQALQSGYSTDAAESLQKVRDSFINELDAPTSEAKGDFARKH